MKQALNTNAPLEPLGSANPLPIVATGDLTTLPSSTGVNLTDPLEAIRVRAETVSKLLKEIMDRGSMRHWGINE